MQFNTGDPNLVALSRLRAGDPSGSANPLWSDQEHKDSVNIAYDKLLVIARRVSEGWQEKISYADAVADQIYYALPTGFLNFTLVGLSGNGSDLSTVSPADADIAILDPLDSDTAIRARDTDVLDESRHVIVQGTNYGIFSPPKAANVGTNSIKLVYSASSTVLSSNSDEPIIHREFHADIAMGSAYYLLLGKQLPVADIRAEWMLAKQDWKAAAKGRLKDKDLSIPGAGFIPYLSRLPRSGTVRKL